MLPVAVCCAATLAFGASTMQTGKALLKSAGALAIGPDGILFVGDSAGAAIYALDVNDRTPARSAGAVEVKGIKKRSPPCWAPRGPDPHSDVVVNPSSKNITFRSHAEKERTRFR